MSHGHQNSYILPIFFLNVMRCASLKSVTQICTIPKNFKFRKFTFLFENKRLGRICPIRSQGVKPDFQKIMSKKQNHLTENRHRLLKLPGRPRNFYDKLAKG